VGVYELLDYLKRLAFQFNSLLRQDFLDFSQEVDSHILVSVVLKDVAGQLNACEALSMNEVAEISTGAASRTVVVSTRDGSIVAGFNELVGIGRVGGRSGS